MKTIPDYVFDPAAWDTTFDWGDRNNLIDDLAGELWEPREFSTLLKGPPVWAVEVVLTWDDSGDPDETEVQWFDDLDAAKAAAKGE